MREPRLSEVALGCCYLPCRAREVSRCRPGLGQVRPCCSDLPCTACVTVRPGLGQVGTAGCCLSGRARLAALGCTRLDQVVSRCGRTCGSQLVRRARHCHHRREFLGCRGCTPRRIALVFRAAAARLQPGCSGPRMIRRSWSSWPRCQGLRGSIQRRQLGRQQNTWPASTLTFHCARARSYAASYPRCWRVSVDGVPLPIATVRCQVHTARMSTGKLERSLYLTSRTLADARAVRSGRIGKRVARRLLVRSLFRLFR